MVHRINLIQDKKQKKNEMKIIIAYFGFRSMDEEAVKQFSSKFKERELFNLLSMRFKSLKHMV